MEAHSWEIDLMPSRNWTDQVDDEPVLDAMVVSPIESDVALPSPIGTLVVTSGAVGKAAVLGAVLPPKQTTVARQVIASGAEAQGECSLYVVDADAELPMVVVVAPDDADPDVCPAWARHLITSHQPERVIVLCQMSSAFYVHSATHGNEPRPPMVRHVATAAAKAVQGFVCTDQCDPLESPNTLQRVEAAIVSHCHRHNIPCVAYMSLCDLQWSTDSAVALLPQLRHHELLRASDDAVRGSIAQVAALERKKPHTGNPLFL